MRNSRLFAASALMLAVTCCVAPPAEPPAPPPPKAPPPPPPVSAPAPLASDWQDWPRTPGTWTYRRNERGSRAMFGQAGGEARAVLRCDRGAGRIYLSRAGDATGAMTVRTSNTTKAVTVRPTGGTVPYVAAELGVRDPLLDAMAFSRGRVVLEQAGTPPLVLPTYAEIGRVIEDCRG
ncbi:hypothetical protein F1C10_08750 [Sphingomonas sp. NBWT7]|uniref:hypothetical protein n=1 Tax=Sphingomonas sp. NBWT7 TaxID=2596913 RepID=UPI0016286D42|nr:hypothetical protein [Sphingomonas sp. NBWT7]QNE32018.1 hypothetical protein F1C10_08750 [Sphingomonas sp. NBWT7]